ncbi:unnamed protein product [Lampetra planeri]
MSHFEEKSGVVASETPWGRWYQTLEEVVLEVSVPVGTPPREVRCELAPRTLLVKVVGTNLIQGKLWGSVISDESTWTLEDRRVLRVVLVKSHREAGSCWPSLLEGAFPADPITLDNMQKKLTLERFQNENPGFDFSGAEISGNYQGGGPDLSQLGRMRAGASSSLANLVQEDASVRLAAQGAKTTMAASGPRKQEEDSWWSKDTAPGDHDPDNDLDRTFDMSKDVASGGAMCEKGRHCGPTLNGTFIIEEMNGTRHNDDGSMARANGTTPLCNSVKIMNHSHSRQAVNILNGFKDPSFLLDTEFPSGLLELSVESPMPGLSTYSGIWAEKLCSDNLTCTSSLTGTPNVNESPWHGAERRLAGCDADFAFQEMMLLRGSNGDSRHVSEILDGDESKKRDQVGKCPDKLKEFRSIDGLGMVESIADEGGIDNGMDNQGSENSEGADNGDDFIDKCANVAGNKNALQPNPLSTANNDTDDDDACDSDSRGNGLMENKNRLGEWSEGCNITSEINAHATVLLSDSESHSGSKSDNVNNYSDRLILMDDCTATKESLKNCTELPKMPFETDASTTQHLRHGEKGDDKEEHEYEELASKLLLVLDDRDHPKANGNDTNIIEGNNIGSTCDSSCKDNGSDDGDHNPHIPAVENSLCETHQAPCEEDGSCIHSSGQNDGLACNVQNHTDDNNFSCPDRDDSELLPPSRENGALKELMCDGDTWSKVDLALPSERAAELTPDVTPAKSSRFFSGLELCTSTPLMFSMAATTATPLPGPRSRFGFRAPAVTSSKSRGSSVAIPATNLNSTRPGTNLNSTKSIGTNLNCTKSTVTNLNSTKSIVTNLNSTKSTGTNLNNTRPNSYNLNSTRPTSTNLNNTTTATATNLNNTRSIGTNGMGLRAWASTAKTSPCWAQNPKYAAHGVQGRRHGYTGDTRGHWAKGAWRG